jgi:hypothetical protein
MNSDASPPQTSLLRGSDVVDRLAVLPARGNGSHHGGYNDDRDHDPDPHTTACWHGDLPRDAFG